LGDEHRDGKRARMSAAGPSAKRVPDDTTTGGDVSTDQTGPSRTRIIAARILVVLGVVLVVISLFANFVKREALDEETFRGTSQELIANQDIRDQVAATMVEQ